MAGKGQSGPVHRRLGGRGGDGRAAMPHSAPPDATVTKAWALQTSAPHGCPRSRGYMCDARRFASVETDPLGPTEGMGAGTAAQPRCLGWVFAMPVLSFPRLTNALSPLLPNPATRTTTAQIWNRVIKVKRRLGSVSRGVLEGSSGPPALQTHTHLYSSQTPAGGSGTFKGFSFGAKPAATSDAPPASSSPAVSAPSGMS